MKVSIPYSIILKYYNSFESEIQEIEILLGQLILMVRQIINMLSARMVFFLNHFNRNSKYVLWS